jgi:hypothetical protein
MVNGEIISFKWQFTSIAYLPIPFNQIGLGSFPCRRALKSAPCLSRLVVSPSGVMLPIPGIEIIPNTVSAGIGIHRFDVFKETLYISDDGFAGTQFIVGWSFVISIETHLFRRKPYRGGRVGG